MLRRNVNIQRGVLVNMLVQNEGALNDIVRLSTAKGGKRGSANGDRKIHPHHP